jgi:spore coat polysaccharide biosynthesis predicted glycosyltransferase SpsG
MLINKGDIFILTGSNKKVGLGHKRRSIQLSSTLKEEGFNTTLKNYYESPWEEIVKIVNNNQYNYIILDLPFYHKKVIKYFEKKKVIALDYFGDDYLPLTISVFKHKSSNNAGTKLFGLKYAIIRSDVLDFRPKGDFLTKNIKNILIIMGSGDLKNFGRSISIKLSKNYNVTLIEGKKPRQSKIKKTRNFRHLIEPKNIAYEMFNCDFAYSNGGSTMLELLHLGKPVHVFPQTKAEESFSKYFLDINAILSNKPSLIKMPKIEIINKIQINAFKTIDGFGKERIVEEIKKV